MTAGKDSVPEQAKPLVVASDTAGKITDEGIEALKARIGVEIPQLAPFNEYATVDTIRHFAFGYGDDNPLFTDSAYAETTRWGSVIAPPTFIVTTGRSTVRSIPDEVRAKGTHALAGVHEFFSGDEWEWFKPVLPGDRLTKKKALRDVSVKANSKFTGGRTVVIRYRTDWFNARKEVVACYWETFVRAERDAAAKNKKYEKISRPTYTPEMLQRIENAYEHEFVRGAKALYWEDVQVGDQLPEIVKGPLLETEIFAWIRGWGGGIYASKLAYKHRKRHPRFYSLNHFGVPDVVERVHWDDAWAQRVGSPYAYDFGKMRNAWLCHLVTNWMGDEGWLWKMTDRFQALNYLGDTSWVRGRVSGKSITPDGHRVVDLELGVENQRGEISAPGQATVILPSHANGPVRLPQPSADIQP